MRVTLAQVAPVLLDREATLGVVEGAVRESGGRGSALVVFGEALVPGYPVWIERADGACFDSSVQKSLHQRYVEEAVDVGRGDLDGVCRAAVETGQAVVLGVVERDSRRGRTLYASCVFIGSDGRIGSVHRKLMPTYEERLSWGIGDGHGLVTHRVGADGDSFTVGALNCWENWMPLARASLYAQGMDLHVMIWPGSDHNTRDLTRFAARESRSYVVSVGSVIREADVGAGVAHRELFTGERGRWLAGREGWYTNGGSSVANPDGTWLLEPVVDGVGLHTVDLDPGFVLRERQNFDAFGHYSRGDVLSLSVDRRRQWGASFRDE